jgi:hypothetical protein
MPSGHIVAASTEASELLAPDGEVVIGRSLEYFTADQPALGDDLFAGGRMNGLAACRLLRRGRSNIKVGCGSETSPTSPRPGSW